MWAVAMGDVIRETGTVPHRIPFASAAQGEWHNPIAVAQVLLSLVHATGPAGLAAFHLALVALTLSVVLAESRRLGSSSARASVVLTVVVVGCASPFVVVRLPDLSLVMFVIATALMRRQHDHPSGRVWWLVPLFAVWGNLHGGVLVGVAVFAVFLAVSTSAGRVAKRLALAAMTGVALMMTSAGPGTPSYYVGVLGNEAATRGSELWAAPDLGDPLDLTMLAAAATLLAMCVRRGLPAWEWVAAAGLLAGHGDRSPQRCVAAAVPGPGGRRVAPRWRPASCTQPSGGFLGANDGCRSSWPSLSWLRPARVGSWRVGERRSVRLASHWWKQLNLWLPAARCWPMSRWLRHWLSRE